MNENVKVFIRFLKERGCYRKYMRNFNDLESIKYRYEAYGCDNINDFFDMLDCENYVDCAFYWSNNKEGLRYWDNVYQEWEDVLNGRSVIMA